MPACIEMRGIIKDFPGIRANDNISITLEKGEIHALLGENGAGKSTLMSILFGLYRPEAGTIWKDGKEVKIHNPNDANALGIGMLHQHFRLVNNFTVLENIVLGVETTRMGVLTMQEARKRVVALSKQYGMAIDPDAKIADITVGMQQRVEILKLLYRENEILIFDEPTAVLTPQEIVELMKTMRGLVKEGKSILFITHKLEEIKAVADRCTVLRKGQSVGTVQVQDTTKEMLSELMVGRKVVLTVDKTPATPGTAALMVQNMTVKGVHHHGKPAVNNVSFTVHRGEIVCVAGIDGNGQSELVYALAGMLPVDSGRILMGDMDITHASIRARNDWKLSHIPEDRHKHGLVLDYSLEENLILKAYHTPRFQKRGFLRFDRMKAYSEELIEFFDIRAGRGALTDTRSMSGGNQQKTIVARELSEKPDVLLAVQPTRGLDVGAIETIHRLLIEARDDGKAVLLVSLELEEVLSVSDRILVLYEGEIVANLNAQNVTAQELGLYMAGARRADVV